jgi:uncharacterized membrane protein YjfL (UPF0719 family)
MKEMILQFLAAAIGLLAAIILSAGSLYSGMRLLDVMTSGIEEWKELKKGNPAVGLFYAAALVSLMALMSPRIGELLLLLAPLSPATNPFSPAAFLLSLVNFLLALPLALLVIYLTVHAVDRLTGDVNEFAELRKGNIAMSLVFSVSVLLACLMAVVPMESIFTLIKSLESGLL